MLRHLTMTLILCILFSVIKAIFGFENIVITVLAMSVAYFIILDGKIEDINDEIKKLNRQNEKKDTSAGML
jgi:hypothetical protein